MRVQVQFNLALIEHNHKRNKIITACLIVVSHRCMHVPCRRRGGGTDYTLQRSEYSTVRPGNNEKKRA